MVNQSAARLNVSLPERQMIYLSPVPFDCPLVAVVMEGLFPLPSIEGELIACRTFAWTLRLGVVIARTTCAVPTGRATMPTDELMTEAARIASGDAEVLRGVLDGLDEAGDMTITFKPPEGGLQAVELLLTIRADGTL